GGVVVARQPLAALALGLLDRLERLLGALHQRGPLVAPVEILVRGVVVGHARGRLGARRRWLAPLHAAGGQLGGGAILATQSRGAGRRGRDALELAPAAQAGRALRGRRQVEVLVLARLLDELARHRALEPAHLAHGVAAHEAREREVVV